MKENLKQALAHVLWIGGATDTGKTTLATVLSQRHGWHPYHYDPHSHGYLERLAQTISLYRTFLDASIDERWVHPEPDALLQFLLQSFPDCLPLVIEDLLRLPKETMIVAEGFGFLPDLIMPLLSHKYQAVWLVSTEAFKWGSMARRNKPSFRAQASDPERATQNLFQRDMLLAELVQEQAKAWECVVWEVDGSLSIAEMTDKVDRHFHLYITRGTL